MGIEENKKTLQRYFDELMNNGDYSKAEEILHENYTGSGNGGVKGIEGHKQLNQLWHSAGPDMHYETLEMIAEGDIKTPGVNAPEGCIPPEEFIMHFLNMEGFGDVWITSTQKMTGELL